jgi:hypothetical protein
VKPYVKRQKNDAVDAEAICEAVTRPNMRFVPTKTPEQQSCPVLHRTRQLFIRQQTAVINSMRAQLAEFGIGRRGVEQLLEVVADANDARVPEVARACIAALGVQLRALKAQILELGGTVDLVFASDGARCKIEFPLESVSAEQQAVPNIPNPGVNSCRTATPPDLKPSDPADCRQIDMSRHIALMRRVRRSPLSP